MFRNKLKKSISAFTMIELSIVIIILSLITTGIIGGQKLVELSKLSRARQITNKATFINNKNLVLWLEPTLKESFGTFSDGNKISQWNSLNDIEMSPTAEGTSDQHPTFVPDGIGRVPSVRFDGIDDYMDFGLDYVQTLNPKEFTIFIVCSVSGNENKWRSPLTSRSNIAPGISGYIFYASSTNQWDFWFGDSSAYHVVMNSGESASLGSAVVLNSTRDNSITKFYVNNNLKATDSSSFSRNRNYPTRIGAGMTEHSPPPTDGYFFDGYISEIIIYKKALSNNERTRVYEYLAKKYKIN